MNMHHLNVAQEVEVMSSPLVHGKARAWDVNLVARAHLWGSYMTREHDGKS